jgi:hypothetical protein
MLLAAFLLSCQPSVDFPISLELDSRWSQEETKIIGLAFEEWKEKTEIAEYHISINLEIDSFDGELVFDQHRIFRASKSEADQFRADIGDPYMLGYTEHGESLVIVGDEIYDRNELYRVMLHEIGHLYGITAHIEGPSVMNAHSGNIPNELDQATLNAFWDIYER